MWIAQKNIWDDSHTDLSKYFIERIKQKVDFEEIIYEVFFAQYWRISGNVPQLPEFAAKITENFLQDNYS